MDSVTKHLFEMQDLEYKNFHSKLMPTINPDKVIGIRIPILRKYAKEFFKSRDCESFFNKLPHNYYEENNLHAFLIEQIKNFDEAVEKTEKFLPYIDNWATSDMFLPKVFKKNKEKLFDKICKWIKSDKTYTVRYAIGLLLKLYLDEDFSELHLKMVCEIKSEEYYINMMRAWYFATALSKKYTQTMPYIEQNKLDKWTHNKTIQKAIESYRIDKNVKETLKALKL